MDAIITNIIHKQIINSDKLQIDLPANTTVLSVGLDPAGVPCIWYQFNPDVTVKKPRTFITVFTGEPFDPIGMKFIGHFTTSSLVRHVFEKF